MDYCYVIMMLLLFSQAVFSWLKIGIVIIRNNGQLIIFPEFLFMKQWRINLKLGNANDKYICVCSNITSIKDFLVRALYLAVGIQVLMRLSISFSKLNLQNGPHEPPL